jgi:bifunctional DNA-binding transcriptional regulator/antitoxin component of YhaV-PrlF toxin-antitoxin module
VAVSVYKARITDDWLPLPDGAIRELGWREGDEIEVEVIDGVVVLTKVADGSKATVRKARE